MFIDVGLTTIEPLILQFLERQAVAFQVMDTPEGGSARGEWAGRFAGVVRPLLKWNTVLCDGNCVAEPAPCEAETN